MAILRLPDLGLELDLEQRLLSRDGEAVSLPPVSMRLLAYLAANHDRVVPREELLGEVWRGVHVTESSLHQALWVLRSTLLEGARDRAQAVRTLRGRGYQLAPRVEEVEPGGGGTPLLSREAELERFAASLDQARRGHGSLVLVSGEPGIGKSRILMELVARARRQGAAAAMAHCSESGATAPLAPGEELLRALASSTLEGSTVADARILRTAFPSLGDGDHAPPASQHPRAEVHRLFEAVRRALLAGAGDRPLVLALDDVHRADAASLQLLTWIAERSDESTLVVVASYRDAVVAQRPTLREAVAHLLRLPSAREERLEGLPRDGVAALARSQLERLPSPDLIDALCRSSGGNPFLLLSLLRRHDFSGSGARGPSLPAQEAVLAHLKIVSPRTRHVLSVASVLGREVSVSILERCLGEEIPMGECLREAAEAGLLRTATRIDEQVEFAHALVMETLYERLDPTERTRLHARVAKILEEEPREDDAHVAALAEHAWLGAHELGPRAARHCERAARAALRRRSFADAARRFEQALDLSTTAPPAERLVRLLDLGEARAQAAEREGAEVALKEAIDLAVALGDDGAHARAVLALALARGMDTVIVGSDWIATLERALEAHRAETPERARLLSCLAHAVWFRPPLERARSLIYEAVDLARRLGDADALAHALVHAHRICQHGPGDMQDRLAATRDLARVAPRIEDRTIALDAALAVLWDALAVGDRRLYDEQVAGLQREAALLGTPHAEWYAVIAQASRAHLEGRFSDAEAWAGRALALGESVALEPARHSYAMQMQAIRRDQGRLAELEGLVGEQAQAMPQIVAWQIAWACAQLAAGRRAAPRAVLRQISADRCSGVRRGDSYVEQLLMLADLAVGLGEAEAAAAVHDALGFASELHGAAGLGYVHWGSVARALGALDDVLGRLDSAERHFEEGLARDRAMGALPFVARGLVELGSMLAHRAAPGDGARARALLDEGIELARELGMAHLEAVVIEAR